MTDDAALAAHEEHMTQEHPPLAAQEKQGDDTKTQSLVGKPLSEIAEWSNSKDQRERYWLGEEQGK